MAKSWLCARCQIMIVISNILTQLHSKLCVTYVNVLYGNHALYPIHMCVCGIYHHTNIVTCFFKKCIYVDCNVLKSETIAVI